ncbi:MAG TPA: glycine zipper domain-containing protein, partial [Planctomycetaceae bacterium]|nr:glycine zipper domain-containing protein [Planctomycetaceae bacterium]
MSLESCPRLTAAWLLTVMLPLAGGCASPYRADQGALYGGLGGAGIGALVGEAVNQPLAGAAIGAAVGTLSGAAVGASLDDIEARNRAEIAARLGRPAPVGAVTVTDVIAMTQAGVSEPVIVNHIRAHGVAAPPGTNDLITLQSNGVSAGVIQAMQTSPGPAVVVGPGSAPMPPPVIIERHYWDDPWSHHP